MVVHSLSCQLFLTMLYLLLQPWYAALEEMQYLLPDEDSREKVAAESWTLKVDRLKEGTLGVSPIAGYECCQASRTQCIHVHTLQGPSSPLFSSCGVPHTGCMLCADLFKSQDTAVFTPAPSAGP